MYGATMKPHEQIDPNVLSLEAQDLEKYLLNKVIGQDQAVSQLVHTYQTFRSGLQAPNRPLGVLLFLGPTGSGKTRLVEVLAEFLFGTRDAMLKIDCAEFTHDHEIAKLIGAPPGYLGHDKTAPRLTQIALNKYHQKDKEFSILLFDEIEKACDDLYELMLGILSDARLTLGDNALVDFTKTLIIMTSNVGSDSLQTIIEGRGLGFLSTINTGEETDELLWTAAKDALKKKFAPEFVNRINRSIVFHTLSNESMKRIMDLEITAIQNRIIDAGYFIILDVTDEAKEYMLKVGIDTVYGARELTRALDRLVVEPISNLIATKQVQDRDLIVADYKSGDSLIFHRVEGLVDPPPPLTATK